MWDKKTTYASPKKDVTLTTLQKGMVLDLMVDVSSKTLENLKSMLSERNRKFIIRLGLKYVIKQIESNISKKLQGKESASLAKVIFKHADYKNSLMKYETTLVFTNNNLHKSSMFLIVKSRITYTVQ